MITVLIANDGSEKIVLLKKDRVVLAKSSMILKALGDHVKPTSLAVELSNAGHAIEDYLADIKPE